MIWNFSFFRYLKNYLRFWLPYAYAPAFMRRLSICVRNWCASWAYSQGTGAHAEHTRQELMRMLSIYASVFPFFKWPFFIPSVKITNLKEVPSNHAEHTRKELVRMQSIRVRKMLSIRISSLRVCSACASETKCGVAPSKIKIIS